MNYEHILNNFFDIPIVPRKQPRLSMEYPADLFYFYLQFENGDIVEINFVDSFAEKILWTDKELKEYYGFGLDETDKLSVKDPDMFKQICNWIYDTGKYPMPIEIYYAEA